METLPQIGKLLILGGTILVILGLALVFGVKFPGFGQFSGDIIIKKGAFSFYFPVATCLIVSLILTLLFALLRMYK